jgi:hypothetical protein
MKKFMAIYLATRAEIDKFMSQPEDVRTKAAQADMEKWNAWNAAHKADLVDEGTMFGKTKRITAAGASDAKNEMTGYSIVQAASYDDALKIFNRHPYLEFPGSSIDLMEMLKF